MSSLELANVPNASASQSADPYVQPSALPNFEVHQSVRQGMKHRNHCSVIDSEVGMKRGRLDHRELHSRSTSIFDRSSAPDESQNGCVVRYRVDSPSRRICAPCSLQSESQPVPHMPSSPGGTSSRLPSYNSQPLFGTSRGLPGSSSPSLVFSTEAHGPPDFASTPHQVSQWLESKPKDRNKSTSTPNRFRRSMNIQTYHSNTNSFNGGCALIGVDVEESGNSISDRLPMFCSTSQPIKVRRKSSGGCTIYANSFGRTTSLLTATEESSAEAFEYGTGSGLGTLDDLRSYLPDTQNKLPRRGPPKRYPQPNMLCIDSDALLLL